MDAQTLPSRRTFLKAAPAAVVVAALPSLAIAETGKLASLIETHKSALSAQEAAGDREDAAFALYHQTMDAAPVTIDLPGLRWLPNGMSRPVNAQQISPAKITEIYDHYGFYSCRGGALYIDGGFKPIDLSADRERDEAAAQGNLMAAFERIKAVAADCGLTAAEADACDCDNAVTAALFAILAHTPETVAEGEAKAVYLLGLMAEGGSDYFHQSDMIRTLIASFAGPVSSRLLAEAAETNPT